MSGSAPLRLGLVDKPNPVNVDVSSIPQPSLKLLHLVLKNASSTPLSSAEEEPHKYHKVNLLGNAGAKLQSSSRVMEILASVGFVTVGDDIVFKVGGLMDLARVSESVTEKYERLVVLSTPAPGPAASSKSSSTSSSSSYSAPLTLKQQARALAEANEKEERDKVFATKAKKRNIDGGLSMKQQSRISSENTAKAAMATAAASKKATLDQISADKIARSDPSWVAATAGDKANGKVMETFRDKFGNE